MEKNKLHQIELSDDKGTCFTLEYWLTSKEILDSLDNEEKAYGIEIVKCNKDNTKEKEAVYCLTCCKATALEWIDLLAKGNATPVSLVPLADNFMYC